MPASTAAAARNSGARPNDRLSCAPALFVAGLLCAVLGECMRLGFGPNGDADGGRDAVVTQRDAV